MCRSSFSFGGRNGFRLLRFATVFWKKGKFRVFFYEKGVPFWAMITGRKYPMNLAAIVIKSEKKKKRFFLFSKREKTYSVTSGFFYCGTARLTCFSQSISPSRFISLIFFFCCPARESPIASIKRTNLRRTPLRDWHTGFFFFLLSLPTFCYYTLILFFMFVGSFFFLRSLSFGHQSTAAAETVATISLYPPIRRSFGC